MTHIKKYIHQYILLFVTVVCGLIAQNNLKKTDSYGTPFVSDIDQYYSILPSAFLYSDVAYAYDTAGNWNKYYEEGTFGTRYWTTEYLPNRRMTMATLGLPYAYSLFFIPAMVVDTLVGSDQYAPGYSPVYVLFAKIYGLVLALIAVLIFYKISQRYAPNTLSVLLSLSVFFGTGTFYYFFGEGLMPHATLTVLIATFVWSCLKLLIDGDLRYLPLLAFLITWIGLIRPTDGIILVFPLLLLTSTGSRFNLWKALMSLKRLLLSTGLIALLVVPQLLYWHYITGSYILYSYKEEAFHFLDWHLMDFWFSARKGWFVYTPLCLLALLMPFFQFKQIKKEAIYAMLVCLVASLVYSQWWCWWYGGSFGMRTMTQFAPLLIILLASLAKFSGKGKTVMLVLVGVLVVNNIRLSRAYHHGKIHYDSESVETLKLAYFNLEKSFNYFDQLVVPDYKGARRNGIEFEFREVKKLENLKSSDLYVGNLKALFKKEHGYLAAKIYHEGNLDNVAAVLKVYNSAGDQIFYKQKFFNESTYNQNGVGFNMIEYKFEKVNFENYSAVFFVHNPDSNEVLIEKLELDVY